MVIAESAAGLRHARCSAGDRAHGPASNSTSAVCDLLPRRHHYGVPIANTPVHVKALTRPRELSDVVVPIAQSIDQLASRADSAGLAGHAAGPGHPDAGEQLSQPAR